MKSETIKSQLIHPEDRNEMLLLSDKWGVTLRQLNEAILYTGSLDRKKLKKYLKNKGELQLPIVKWLCFSLEMVGSKFKRKNQKQIHQKLFYERE